MNSTSCAINEVRAVTKLANLVNEVPYSLITAACCLISGPIHISTILAKLKKKSSCHISYQKLNVKKILFF